MSPAAIFLVLLLVAVLTLNWRFLAARFGLRGVACNWSRVATRDRDGRRAWFCPACRREELVDGKGPPPDCGRRYNEPREPG